MQRGWLLRLPLSQERPSRLDAEIWDDILGVDQTSWREQYTKLVIAERFSPKYLPPATWVPIPRSLCEAMLSSTIGDPQARRSASSLEAYHGWLVRDAARVWPIEPGPDLGVLSEACVEIKPKHGAVGDCWTVPPKDRDLKHVLPRFTLHQALKGSKHEKMGEGAPFVRSKYDPRDLLSGSETRVLTALHALHASPQNNLRVVNIEPDGTVVESTVGEAARRLLDASARTTPAIAGTEEDALLAMLASILCREGRSAGIVVGSCRSMVLYTAR